VTLDHSDKRPYGSFLAYESLKFFFPDAQIKSLSPAFKYTSIDQSMKYATEGRTLLVLNGFNFRLSELEWRDLKSFVYAGNEVVILASTIDDRIEEELGFVKGYAGEDGYLVYAYADNHANKNVLSLSDNRNEKYGYRGRSVKGYFSFHGEKDTATDKSREKQSEENDNMPAADTVHASDASTGDDTYANSSNGENTGDGYTWSQADTLGYCRDSFPDVIRYATGEGHITFHAAPLVMSNYFLLQDKNIQYLSSLWHTLPGDITRIYWSDYYARSTELSDMEVLWRYASTKAAVLLAILLLLVYILFEGKRKQRIIPVIAPLKNDSVSFVETVGRLYYNKGNHANLAEKMTQQFLEWVRTYYLLNTNLLNEQFIQQLTIKSGEPEAMVRSLTDMIHEIRLKSVAIDDAYLYQLYNIIQKFYKNHRI